MATWQTVQHKKGNTLCFSNTQYILWEIHGINSSCTRVSSVAQALYRWTCQWRGRGVTGTTLRAPLPPPPPPPYLLLLHECCIQYYSSINSWFQLRWIFNQPTIFARAPLQECMPYLVYHIHQIIVEDAVVLLTGTTTVHPVRIAKLYTWHNY